MSIGRITVIQGGQYGSESKGMVAAEWARKHGIPNVVRTGSINAGHTVYHNGVKYVFQSIPTASVFKDKKVYIGPGAYIHRETLEREVKMVEAIDPDFKKRLFIDHRATMHTSKHMADAASANRHVLMGATGKGCAEVMMHKIAGRGSDNATLASQELKHSYNLVELSEHIEGDVLLEGTQGSELDVHLGPYPFVTSRMTSPAAWVAEAGLPVNRVQVVTVFRTFPIRVAGNSGPMPNEISWLRLARDINRKLEYECKPPLIRHNTLFAYEVAMNEAVAELKLPSWPHVLPDHVRGMYAQQLSTVDGIALSKMYEEDITELKKLFEFTTVTKKLRRIARFDHDTAIKVIRREQPVALVMTFMNYLFPSLDANEATRWVWGKFGSEMPVYKSFNPYTFF